MSAYTEWVQAGKPWDLAEPIGDLADLLDDHYGYTVYTIGNDAHLTASPPEDHTPYSATGWPGMTPRWYVTAEDIMPPPAGSTLPTLVQLGRQLYTDKQAGHPGLGWLKYMNWTDENGDCWHDSWQPGHERRTSSDRGHIHLSGRSDRTVDPSIRTTGYDPVARVRGIMPEATLPYFDPKQKSRQPNYRQAQGTQLGDVASVVYDGYGYYPPPAGTVMTPDGDQALFLPRRLAEIHGDVKAVKARGSLTDQQYAGLLDAVRTTTREVLGEYLAPVIEALRGVGAELVGLGVEPEDHR